VRAPVKLFLASSNSGKAEEFRVLAHTASGASASDGEQAPREKTIAAARGASFEIELLLGFASLPAFEENAPTFAENAAGKALYYSQTAAGLVFADDSGLVVPALGGAPGVRSARYAGPYATSAERIAKLLGELRGKAGDERKAYFVCAIALAQKGRALAVVTDRVDGEILEASRGKGGFGYDPVFYFPPAQKTFAELTAAEKNKFSHRGKSFRKLLAALQSP
jgi:XTP/dITP diphosphohydrolase